MSLMFLSVVKYKCLEIRVFLFACKELWFTLAPVSRQDRQSVDHSFLFWR
jgi:hypothetical protein